MLSVLSVRTYHAAAPATPGACTLYTGVAGGVN